MENDNLNAENNEANNDNNIQINIPNNNLNAENNNANNNQRRRSRLTLIIPFYSLRIDFKTKEGTLITEPLKESFFTSFLPNFLCPNATIKSPSFIVILLTLIIYIITLCYGIDGRDSLNFLPPKIVTSDNFSCLNIKQMKGDNKLYESYRWIMNMLIHLSLTHWIINTLGYIVFGTILDLFVTKLQFFVLLYFSAFNGNLFSTFINTSPTVGTNSPLFALLGGLIMFFIVNWRYLDRVIGGWGKYYILYLLSMYILISLIYLVSHVDVNVLGEYCSLVCGMFMYIALLPSERLSSRLKMVKICSGVVMIMFFVIGMVLFYVI